MVRSLLLAVLLVGCQGAPARPASFPSGWCGTWVGELRIFGDGKPKSVPMELEVARRDGGYRWKTVYGAGAGRDVRDYVLRVVDEKRGEYEIDERNSIQLPATFRAGVLINKFEVGQSEVLSTYRLVGDALLFELFASSRATPRRSGGGAMPAVQGFQVRARQEAVLRKASGVR